MTDLVYLSTNGVKSHIKSVENFDKVGFDWDKIQVMLLRNMRSLIGNLFD